MTNDKNFSMCFVVAMQDIIGNKQQCLTDMKNLS